MKRLMKALPICAAALLFSAAAPGIAAAGQGWHGGHGKGQYHVVKHKKSSKHFGHRGHGRKHHARRHGHRHGYGHGFRHGRKFRHGRRHFRHARRHYSYSRPYVVYAPYYGYRGYRY